MSRLNFPPILTPEWWRFVEHQDMEQRLECDRLWRRAAVAGSPINSNSVIIIPPASSSSSSSSSSSGSSSDSSSVAPGTSSSVVPSSSYGSSISSSSFDDTCWQWIGTSQIVVTVSASGTSGGGTYSTSGTVIFSWNGSTAYVGNGTISSGHSVYGTCDINTVNSSGTCITSGGLPVGIRLFVNGFGNCDFTFSGQTLTKSSTYPQSVCSHIYVISGASVTATW